MDLFRWLETLGKTCRDDISAEVIAAWAGILSAWRRLTEESWTRIARQVVRNHRMGPVRFCEIEDAWRDEVSDLDRKAEAARLREIERGEAVPCPPELKELLGGLVPAGNTEEENT